MLELRTERTAGYGEWTTLPAPLSFERVVRDEVQRLRPRKRDEAEDEAPKRGLRGISRRSSAGAGGSLFSHAADDFDDLHSTQLPKAHPAHLLVADMVLN